MRLIFVLLILLVLIPCAAQAVRISELIVINTTVTPSSTYDFITSVQPTQTFETLKSVYATGTCAPYVKVNRSNEFGIFKITITLPEDIPTVSKCELNFELEAFNDARPIIAILQLPIALYSTKLSPQTTPEMSIPASTIVQSTIAPVSTVIIPPTQVPQSVNVSAPKVPEVPMFLFGVGIFILGVILFSVYIFKNRESEDETFTLER